MWHVKAMGVTSALSRLLTWQGGSQTAWLRSIVWLNIILDGTLYEQVTWGNTSKVRVKRDLFGGVLSTWRQFFFIFFLVLFFGLRLFSVLSTNTGPVNIASSVHYGIRLLLRTRCGFWHLVEASYE